MKKVIIGIVSRPITSNSDRNMLGVYENYIRCVIKAGGIPIIISPIQDIEYESYNVHVKLDDNSKEKLDYILKLCDGIIMPGGDKAFKYDYYILDHCISNNIPVLGICLGMQIMCSNNNDFIPVYNHYLTNHKIEIVKDSLLYDIFNKDIMYVNSRHKEQVKNSGVYRVVAKSDDEVIEAVELDSNTFNVGVEWHPEDIDNQILFDRFIEITKKQKK